MYLYVVGAMVAQWWEHLPPPPMWPWFASWCRLHTLYVGWVCSWFRSLLCSKRFFSGFCSLPLSLKTNTSKFQSDLVCTDAFQQVLMRGMDMYIPVWFMSIPVWFMSPMTFYYICPYLCHCCNFNKFFLCPSSVLCCSFKALLPVDGFPHQGLPMYAIYGVNVLHNLTSFSAACEGPFFCIIGMKMFLMF